MHLNNTMPNLNLQRRNEAVRTYVNQLSSTYPHWKFAYIIARKAFLSPHHRGHPQRGGRVQNK